MKTYKTKSAIKKILAKLKAASIAGFSNDGAQVVVRITFRNGDGLTTRAAQESAVARRAGLDLKTFSGPLDRVWKAGTGLCFTILATQRVDLSSRAYCYRTFNVDSGQIKELSA